MEKEYHPDWDQYKIWDLVANNDESVFRAYSMANHPAEGNRVMLNVRIATPPLSLWDEAPPGLASSYIFNLKAGDKVTISVHMENSLLKTLIGKWFILVVERVWRQ